MTENTFSYCTDRLALRVDKQSGKILYLGIESGGRNTAHRDTNLLRPGLASGLCLGEDIQVADCSEHEIVFENQQRRCVLSVEGDGFSCHFSSKNGQPLSGRLLALATAPNIAPSSLWARPDDWNKDETSLHSDPLKPQPFIREYQAPGMISFPSYGLLQCTSKQAFKIRHIQRPSQAHAGYNLGFANFGDHNNRMALHEGSFEYEFIADEHSIEITIELSVADEIFPQLGNVDLSAARWNGLKRNWMNNFTLHPATLTLGDNPILSGCGHLAIHWKSDISIFTPAFFDDLRVQHFFRQALRITFFDQCDAQGKLSGYGWENAACNIMALHAYVLGTADWSFVEELLPQLEKVIEYNLSLDQDGDGILEAHYHGNDMSGEITSLNWWDAFAFGHKDAYANLVFYAAFKRILPVLQQLGADSLSQRLEKSLALFQEHFHDTFYNPKTGVYAGWISKDGRVHDYMFTFITAMAINAGLVEGQPAQKMMQILLDQLDESGYGAYRFGVPGPAIPVAEVDRTTWAPMADWGRYENGGFCGQTAYHFILALYNCGLREKADTILFSMLDTFEQMPTHSGLNTRFGHSVDWRTRDGQPCGYNYLADNYVFVLAAIQGHFQIPLPDLPAYPERR